MFTSIAILGRPNVGKSTLFNKLTNTRDAIVSDFSGLTKDRNYGYLKIGNISSLIVDTGGIDTSESIFTDKISEQAWFAAEEANLILFILDSSDELTNEDINILQKLRKLDKLFIPVLNKIDRKSDSSIKSDLEKRGIADVNSIAKIANKGIGFMKGYNHKLNDGEDKILAQWIFKNAQKGWD